MNLDNFFFGASSQAPDPSPVVAKLRKAAEDTCHIARRYIERKRSIALMKIEEAVTSICDEIDKEGENYWKKEMENVDRDWKEGGVRRIAWELEQKERLRKEYDLVYGYVNDQHKLARNLAAKELRDSIVHIQRKTIDRVKYVFDGIEKQALVRRNRIGTSMDNLDADTQEESNNGLFKITSDSDFSCMNEVHKLYSRISKANQSSLEVIKRNIELAKKIASLRFIARSEDENR
jgi:hypothetical protein